MICTLELMSRKPIVDTLGSSGNAPTSPSWGRAGFDTISTLRGRFFFTKTINSNNFRKCYVLLLREWHLGLNHLGLDHCVEAGWTSCTSYNGTTYVFQSNANDRQRFSIAPGSYQFLDSTNFTIAAGNVTVACCGIIPLLLTIDLCSRLIDPPMRSRRGSGSLSSNSAQREADHSPERGEMDLGLKMLRRPRKLVIRQLRTETGEALDNPGVWGCRSTTVWGPRDRDLDRTPCTAA